MKSTFGRSLLLSLALGASLLAGAPAPAEAEEPQSTDIWVRQTEEKVFELDASAVDTVDANGNAVELYSGVVQMANGSYVALSDLEYTFTATGNDTWYATGTTPDTGAAVYLGQSGYDKTFIVNSTEPLDISAYFGEAGGNGAAFTFWHSGPVAVADMLSGESPHNTTAYDLYEAMDSMTDPTAAADYTDPQDKNTRTLAIALHGYDASTPVEEGAVKEAFLTIPGYRRVTQIEDGHRYLVVPKLNHETARHLVVAPSDHDDPHAETAEFAFDSGQTPTGSRHFLYVRGAAPEGEASNIGDSTFRVGGTTYNLHTYFPFLIHRWDVTNVNASSYTADLTGDASIARITRDDGVPLNQLIPITDLAKFALSFDELPGYLYVDINGGVNNPQFDFEADLYTRPYASYATTLDAYYAQNTGRYLLRSHESSTTYAFEGLKDAEGTVAYNENLYQFYGHKVVFASNVMQLDDGETKLPVWCVEPMVPTNDGSGYKATSTNDGSTAALIMLLGDDSTDLHHALNVGLVYKTVGWVNGDDPTILKHYELVDGQNGTEAHKSDLTADELADAQAYIDGLKRKIDAYQNGTLSFTSQTEGATFEDGTLTLKSSVRGPVVLEASNKLLFSLFPAEYFVFPAGVEGTVDHEAGTLTLTVDRNQLAGDAAVKMATTDGTSTKDIEFKNDYGKQKLMYFGTKPREESFDFKIEQPAPVEVALGARKTLDGEDAAGTGFSFELRDAEGATVKTVQNDGAVVDFGVLTFAEEGTYRYTLSEVKGSDSAVTYDESVFGVTIVVALNDEGALEASVTYSADGQELDGVPEFKNTTTPEEPEKPGEPEEPEDDEPEEPYKVKSVKEEGEKPKDDTPEHKDDTPKLQAEEPEPQPERPSKPSLPQTGDELLPFLAAAAMGAIAFVAGLVARRRKQGGR